MKQKKKCKKQTKQAYEATEPKHKLTGDSQSDNFTAACKKKDRNNNHKFMRLRLPEQ